jgi:hypothetical protein
MTATVGRRDEVGCDAMPDAAGGEGGDGVAKPEGVVHRYAVTDGKGVASQILRGNSELA